MKYFKLFVSINIFLISCKTAKKIGVISEKAMVVSARKEASKIGVDILKKGGNAFDAMIATELALAVSYPYAGNIGGGGFMVYRKNTGEVGALDYREKAPIMATKDMYLDSLGNVVKGKSTIGAMSVGVPGTIAGVFEVHEKFGSLTIKEILDPVISLAERGVVITKKQAKRITKYKSFFKKVNRDSILFQRDWKEKDTIKYTSLAKTLRRIQKYGKDEFYKGRIGIKLVEFIQDNGGIITLEDLANYKAVWRKPIIFKYDDLKIISMSPPSSGGICLAQIMNAIEPYDLHDFKHNSVKSIQVITEAERRAYADRSFFLGDPDFVKIPVDTLIGKKYAINKMNNFSFDISTKSIDVSHGEINFKESNETTHYSIVDQFGNAVSVTTTLNGAYGSKLFSNELGFFLNNEMDDFSSKPGIPNMFRLIGAEANKITPGKRMLSSMSPTIVEKSDNLLVSNLVKTMHFSAFRFSF